MNRRAPPPDTPRPIAARGALLAVMLGATLATLAALCGPAPAAPATLIGTTGPNSATGGLGTWDFGGTDMTFKAARGELWVLDAHSDTLPFVNIFRLGDRANPFPSPPRRLPLNLPSELLQGRVLGIAEIPAGALGGLNLILADRTFGTDAAPDPVFAVLDDDGNLADGVAPSPVGGLPAGARLSSIDLSPDGEEIAAYDLAQDRVHVLDLGFNAIGTSFPVLGLPSFFIGSWAVGGQLRGSGAGLAYSAGDRILVSSGFFNAFEVGSALEYDVATGAYTGDALDLSLRTAADTPRQTFLTALAAGTLGDDPVLAALDLATDAVYLFDREAPDEPPPVTLTACQLDGATGRYILRWTFPEGFAADSVCIIENGVQTASLPADATEYVSPLPLLGKTLVEVALEKGGSVSGLRPVCQMENTAQPPLEGIDFTALRIADRGGIEGVAVTKAPESLEAFRAFILGRDSNAITVLDHTLGPAATVFGATLSTPGRLALSPVVAGTTANLPARGLALVRLDGRAHLALLDSDGPLGNGQPSAAFHGIEGSTPGALTLAVDAIDLTALSPRPTLLDWDWDADGHFVAGAVVDRGGGNLEYGIVRIEFEGASLRAVSSTPIPHRALTPFDDLTLTGVGVAVLPSGNLLVAGSDTFSRTYTEALLMTPFTEDPASPPRLVGYAQGLLVWNQFNRLASGSPVGPGIGPRTVGGLDAAYFAPADGTGPGVGVSYLSTPNVVLLDSPSPLQFLQGTGQLLIHSTNECAHPDLAAEPLAEVAFDLAAGASRGTGAHAPSFADAVDEADYFYYAVNASRTEAATLLVTARHGGAIVGGDGAEVRIPPGRYYRGSLRGVEPASFEVAVENRGAATATVRLIAGSMGIRVREPSASSFRRGDCGADGAVTISDPIYGLSWLFLGGEEPPCPDACDSDDDGSVNLSDMILTLNYLFMGGEPLEPPGAEGCGSDPTTDDGLGACVYAAALCR